MLVLATQATDTDTDTVMMTMTMMRTMSLVKMSTRIFMQEVKSLA